IARAGGGNGPGGGWPAQFPGDGLVGAGLSGGNSPQRVPYSVLEVGARYIERKHRIPSPVKAVNHLVGVRLECSIISLQPRLRKLSSKSSLQVGGVVAQHDAAEPAIGGRRQQLADRREHHRKADPEASTSSAIHAGSHA